MSTNVQESTHGRYQESNESFAKRSRRVSDRAAPSSSSEWAEVLATADRYF